ncbi:hypothetical protein HQ43_01090 [Porphyromonas canoris]|uniref:Transposase n=1 Tax=Porphyromonas canoris TaxID=36875 RepID=A0ABR4XMD6_9PORP|nr:hypothetical protein HQ43_01090 [Porphyromonas canoris]
MGIEKNFHGHRKKIYVRIEKNLRAHKKNLRTHRKIFTCAQKNIYVRTKKYLRAHKKIFTCAQKKISAYTKKISAYAKKIFCICRNLSACAQKKSFVSLEVFFRTHETFHALRKKCQNILLFF